MSSSFAHAFEEARGEVSLSRLAKAMADPNSKDGRGPVGNLSRLQNGKQKPSQDKIGQIVEALASETNLTGPEKKYWRSRLMSAAGYGTMKTAEKLFESESEVRRSLHPACLEALRTVPDLKEHEIQTILEHVGIPTMKLIIAAAERGEEIEVVQLQRISTELQQTAAGHLSSADRVAAVVTGADKEIDAGRARILIEGELTGIQERLLADIAKMIKTVLAE